MKFQPHKSFNRDRGPAMRRSPQSGWYESYQANPNATPHTLNSKSFMHPKTTETVTRGGYRKSDDSAVSRRKKHTTYGRP